MVKAAPADQQAAMTEAIGKAKEGSAQKALANMAVFPAIMLVAFICLFLYFRSKGGYKPVDLSVGGGEH